MQLNLLTLDTQVRRFSASAQAVSATVLDFTVGSIFRALAEAQASLGLWFQWLLLRVLATTRLATSAGEDVDSFVGDYGLVRLPAVPAVGQVTLSRLTPTQAALVLPGAQVKTLDGSQSFVVTTDTSNPLWSPTAGASPGYLIPAGQISGSVPVRAITAGTGGNVGVGTIGFLGTSIAGVDGVTNPVAFTSGIDAESDVALTLRFQAFIASLAEATKSAVLYAANSVQQGLTLQIVENVPRSGMFTLYADDGSGTPSADLLTRIFVAVDAVRGVGIGLSVQPPALVPVSIAASLAYAPSTDLVATAAVVSAALSSYAASLPMATALDFYGLVQVAQNAAQPAARLAELTVNGAMADVLVGNGQRVHAAAVTVA